VAAPTAGGPGEGLAGLVGRGVKALVDASLLARYLTGDPPHLAEKAAQVLDGEETLGITEVALVETAYALESV